MSKLWNTFQTQHRVSAAYKVSVVLIDSSRPTKTPMPVLMRGAEKDNNGTILRESGIISEPDLIPPTPTLVSISIAEPKKKTAVELGDLMTLRGHNLAGAEIIQLSSRRLQELPDTDQKVGATKLLDVVESSENEVKFKISDEPDNWVVGFYSVSATIKDGAKEETTNEVVFSLVPLVTGVSPNVVTPTGPNNLAQIAVSCSPKILPSQEISVLIGDRSIKVGKRSVPLDKFEIEIDDAPIGKLHVRLRVDGIDSEVIDRDKNPPTFRDNASLEIRKA